MHDVKYNWIRPLPCVDTVAEQRVGQHEMAPQAGRGPERRSGCKGRPNAGLIVKLVEVRNLLGAGHLGWDKHRRRESTRGSSRRGRLPRLSHSLLCRSLLDKYHRSDPPSHLRRQTPRSTNLYTAFSFLDESGLLQVSTRERPSTLHRGVSELFDSCCFSVGFLAWEMRRTDQPERQIPLTRRQRRTMSKRVFLWLARGALPAVHLLLLCCTGCPNAIVS